jgi:hypothetical protein
VPVIPRRCCTRRVILNSVDGLSGQAGLLADLSDTCGLLSQHGAHPDELLAGEARFTPKVGTLGILLRMLDTSPLSRPPAGQP